MDTHDLLVDSFGRIEETYADIADGLEDELLHHRPGGTGNPVGWLLWHLARVQDDHVAGITGEAQVWPTWQDRFGLALDVGDIGFGHTSEQVDSVRITDPGLLTGYHAEVHQATLRCLDGLDDAGLDRIVDRRWDPPVTAGVRLVSVIGDCLQHLGQAAYVKGLGGRG
jgi:hypothetical protein